MKCPFCHQEAVDLLAVFWNDQRWHRACAVRQCGRLIAKLQKKISSVDVTAGNYAQLKKQIEDAELDRVALKKIYKEEKTDEEKAGALLTKKISFGARTDTTALLQSGHITPAEIDGIQGMTMIAGKVDDVGAVSNTKALYHPGTRNNQKLLMASTKKSNAEMTAEEWSAKWKPVFQQRLKENGKLHELEYAGAMKKLGLETKEDVEGWLIQTE